MLRTLIIRTYWSQTQKEAESIYSSQHCQPKTQNVSYVVGLFLMIMGMGGWELKALSHK